MLQENQIPNAGVYNVYGAMGVMGKSSEYQFDSDAVLVLKDGSKVGKLQFAKGCFSVVGTSVILIPTISQDAKYLYFAMSVIDFNKYKVGSGIPHIYFKDYGNERLYYPNETERAKITLTLNKIEQLIAIEKEMLSKLQAQKAYLLQKMFI